MRNCLIHGNYGLHCPICRTTEKWDSLYGLCYYCGFSLQPGGEFPTDSVRPKPLNKETIRTVAAVIGDIMATVSVVLQLLGLHWIMTHPR